MRVTMNQRKCSTGALTQADAATVGMRRSTRIDPVASCWLVILAVAVAGAAGSCCCRSTLAAIPLASALAFSSLSSSSSPVGLRPPGYLASPPTQLPCLPQRAALAELSTPAYRTQKCISNGRIICRSALGWLTNRQALTAGAAADSRLWARRRGGIGDTEGVFDAEADDDDVEDDVNFDLEYDDDDETSSGRADDGGDLLAIMNGMDDEPVDVPDDWTEQDILAELGDDMAVDDDEPDDNGGSKAVIVSKKSGVRSNGRQGSQSSASSSSLSSARAVTSADDVDDGDGDDDYDLDLDDLDVDLDLDEEEEDEEEEGSFECAGEDDVSRKVVSSGDDFDDGSWKDDNDDDEEEDDYSLLFLEDMDDPNEQRLDEIVSEAIEAGEREAQSRAFDPLEFLQRDMTLDQRQELARLPFLRAVEERARGLQLVEQDVTQLDLEQQMSVVTDLMTDDPYPSHSESELNVLEQDVGVTDADMVALDSAYKDMTRMIDRESWDKVMAKDAQPGVWDSLPLETQDEMATALEDMGGSSYNATRWLLYDLDFNVTNLILAAVKHNPKAPVLLQHWYPQLVTYSRYRSAQDRNFDFTWEDVENADVQELQRYYSGFGYDEIPKKAPAETGMIGFEELDEEEIKMAAFENWMTSVYNPEWDRTDFDDDDMRDEDNVFSEFYDPPQHPDLPSFDDSVDDIDEWGEQLDGEESEYKLPAEGRSDDGIDSADQAYRDMMGQKFEYEVVRDPEFEREFRGHLIIACTGSDRDLEVAEQITERFGAEFGKQVYVETRVMALAREEDNVFEVWLESYEIDLLHSKKRATSNTQDWKGPAECDAAQIDYLVGRVRFLISGDARYSYRMDLEHVDA
jgi:hypothetical protein